MSMKDGAYNDVYRFIASLNKSWTTGKNIENLENYFHQNAVALIGIEKQRITGKTACADHWRNCSQKTIYSWEEINPQIEFYNDNRMAVVSYEFKISLEREGRTVNATSRDAFALINEHGKWLIVLATV